MTYKTLKEIITRLADYGRLPQEELEGFEVASGIRNGLETVLLMGLMPKNKHGVRPFVAASCEIVDNNILKDSERIDVFDPKNHNGWERDFYQIGARLGFEHRYLEMKLTILFGGQAKCMAGGMLI